MILREFNKTPSDKIKDINKLLSEQFGFSLLRKTPSKAQLEKLLENAQRALTTLRSGGKKFQLDPEYVKFLCIRDLTQTMMESGMYAESPAYNQMCEHIGETVHDLMDSGYTAEEACSECMNRYRQDSRYAYDDEYVMPIVLRAAKDYVREYGHSMGQRLQELEEDSIQTQPSAGLVRRIAKESGIRMESMHSLDEVELKLEQYAQATGKTRGAVIEFLEGLDDKKLSAGIQMFDRKISETNAFIAARRDAIKHDKKEFEIDGKKYPVTGADKAEVKSIKESVNEVSIYNDAAQDVARAIFHRLQVNHKDQIKSVSTVDVQRAVFDVAERRAKRGVDELGSSDVSILVNRVLDDLGLNNKTNENAGTYLPGSRPPAEVMSRLVDVDLQSLAPEFENPVLVIDFFSMQHSVKQDPDTGEFYMYDDIGEVYHVFDDAYDLEDYAMQSIDKQGEPRYESYLNLSDMMIAEDVDIEQAEVVMAVRALVSDLQDHVERLGRMVNEELPAIADQVRTEMGTDQAQSFLDSTTQLLSTQLEATRTAKEGMDQAVGMLTGEEIGGLGDTGDLGGDDDLDLDDLGLGGDDVVDNIDAASGPEDEPLGRAAI